MTAETIAPETIAIVGTGAMGSVYAALLADAGHDVWAVDAWEDHVRAMNANGLRVEGASGDRTVKVHATTDAADVGKADLVIIATKFDGVEAAARSVKPILKDSTPVVTIQNGLGSAEIVAGILGEERLIQGVVGGFGASMKGPGHAHHNGMEFLRLGEYSGPKSARLEHVAEVWRSGGFKVLTFDDIHKMVWEKLICNTAFSGPCASTGLTVGQMMADPNGRSLSLGCAREAFAVARAKGVNLDFDDVDAYVTNFASKIPGARPSMLLDHLAGRRCEIDVINGAVQREGLRAGVPTPINDVICAVIRAKETVFG
jgi:2-dehydropantoate 2-reductase